MSDEGSIMSVINICATGLDAANRRMEVIANNVANANMVSGDKDKVYSRQDMVFSEKLKNAVGKKKGGNTFQGIDEGRVVSDKRPPKRVYRPEHPEADKEGFVYMPDINAIDEMVNMMSATRSYEANLAMIKASKTMAEQALKLGK